MIYKQGLPIIYLTFRAPTPQRIIHDLLYYRLWNPRLYLNHSLQSWLRSETSSASTASTSSTKSAYIRNLNLWGSIRTNWKNSQIASCFKQCESSDRVFFAEGGWLCVFLSARLLNLNWTSSAGSRFAYAPSPFLVMSETSSCQYVFGVKSGREHDDLFLKQIVADPQDHSGG